jgi:hypothetical protein
MTDHKPPKLKLRHVSEENFPELMSDLQRQVDEHYREHIEPLFANAVELYGCTVGGREWTRHQYDNDTHVGLLIGVREIERGVKQSEVVSEPKRLADVLADHYQIAFPPLMNLADRIEREGVKP